MNRTLYFKNLAIFLLFVAIIFATPFVFAQSTSPTLIRVNKVSIDLKSQTGNNSTNSVLQQGSIIRLPNPIADNLTYNESGEIDVYEMIETWHRLANSDPRLVPTKDERGRLVYPVKVLASSDESLDLESDASKGYIALADLLKRNAFTTVRADENLLMQAPVVADPEPVLSGNNWPAPSDSYFPEGDGVSMPQAEDDLPSETTSPYAPTVSPRPVIRPVDLIPPPATPPSVAPRPKEVTTPAPVTAVSTPASFLNTLFNCNNTIYRSSNFAKYSCLKSLSTKQRVELVMSDVLKINQLRPAFKMDPRMSSCMAYRESGFNPNAKGGTPDWGMYQVIDGTGTHVLKRNRPVTPGFSGLSWSAYRKKMLGSTLSQADLHHSVLYEKAKVRNADLKAMNSAMNGDATRVSSSVVQRIAKRYNGAGSRAERYGNAIKNCYNCMVGISTKTGRVTKSSGLTRCLNKAKH